MIDAYEQRRRDGAPPFLTGEKAMDFADVIRGVKEGRRYARAGWNGKDMFIFLVPGSTFKVNREPLLSILGEGTEVQYHGHIDMMTTQGYVVPWLASQVDMLADDWQETWGNTRQQSAFALDKPNPNNSRPKHGGYPGYEQTR